MNFIYSEAWKEELLKHAYNDDITREEVDRFEELIQMGDFSKNSKVIETLLLAFLQEDLGGMDETLTNTLSSVDYKAYYEVLFKLIPKYLNSTSYWDVSILEMTHGNEYPKEEWEYIESIARQYLDKENIEKIIDSLEKAEYLDDDYLYPEFYQLFQKILKEKSDN